jgi:hypothetical protein
MVRHLVRPANRAEVNGIKRGQLFPPVVWHHLAVLQVVVAIGPVENLKLQLQAKLVPGYIQHAQSFRHDFLTNPVPGYHGNPVFHGVNFPLAARWQNPQQATRHLQLAKLLIDWT